MMTNRLTKKRELFLPARIVSGGQTGVDRGALDAAIALGIAHGGWCPAGRLSEDGSIPSRYELVETDSSEYPVRTEMNVIDSDATLIVYEKKLKGGTLLTRRICQTQNKPYCALRLDDGTPEKRQQAIDTARQWLDDVRPQTLNIAGPRESSHPGIAERTLQFLLDAMAH